MLRRRRFAVSGALITCALGVVWHIGGSGKNFLDSEGFCEHDKAIRRPVRPAPQVSNAVTGWVHRTSTARHHSASAAGSTRSAFSRRRQSGRSRRSTRRSASALARRTTSLSSSTCSRARRQPSEWCARAPNINHRDCGEFELEINSSLQLVTCDFLADFPFS